MGMVMIQCPQRDARFRRALKRIAKAFDAVWYSSRAPIAQSARPITNGSPRKLGSTSRVRARVMGRSQGMLETEEGMALAEVRQDSVHVAHGVAPLDFGAVELPSLVVQSLRSIQAARKGLQPLATDLSTAAALAFGQFARD